MGMAAACSRAMSPADGMSLALDHFEGRIPFEGEVHGENGCRTLKGDILWDTHPPGYIKDRYGIEPSAVDGQRDASLDLVSVDGNGEWTKDGDMATVLAVLDLDLLERLIARDPDAETEIVRIAAANSHIVAHRAIKRLDS